jgi:cobalt/nickel transport protein
MTSRQNLLILLAVIVLAVAPLWIVDTPEPDAQGNTPEIFLGADDKAKNAIGEIAPDYAPWFEPLFEPPSGEIASLLFALQAALGAGFLGYYIGAARAREKLRRELGVDAQALASAPSSGSARAC